MKGKGILLLLMVLFLNACSEVLIEDYIAGTWELKTYLLNDLDQTAEMNISSYAESNTMDGTYSRQYVDGKQNLVDETGKFEINEDDFS